mmetsp:Transcript_44080/g.59753  ORF Transcript_44080/g.59753 Transcript_44080/m.59753 type:complete len:259 (-) Transcript_44080:108-884(-)
MPMVLLVFGQTVYFSWFGTEIFAGTVEGVAWMPDFGTSFYWMMATLSVSVHPDELIPAYQASRIQGMFFIFFNIFCVLLMLSLLTALFYTSYKNQFTFFIQKNKINREQYLVPMFYDKNFCESENGELTKVEAYKLFIHIHGLILNTPETMESHYEEIEQWEFEYIFTKVDNDKSGKFKMKEFIYLMMAYENWAYESKELRLKKMLFDEDFIKQEYPHPTKQWWFRWINSVKHEFIINIVVTLNLISLFIENDSSSQL